jgi:murein DD-endopeptidase MepM/ murein hydrolase activator NlpD
MPSCDDGSSTIRSSVTQPGKNDIATGEFRGLSIGLIVVLIAMGVAASAARSAPRLITASNPTVSPTAPVVAMILTPTPAPSRPSTTPSPVATSTPTSSATPTPSPATSVPVPSPTATPTPQIQNSGETIGHSVLGRPIVAYRFGKGPIKVVLVGDIHGQAEANTYLLVGQLQEYFQAHPGEVPAQVSLWIIPTMNPDGLATDHRWNANDVDLNRNADTDLDGCAGNDWSAETVGLEGTYPNAGGAYPFSEPEIRAVRDFLDDAWIAVFYHSAAGAIFSDTCQRHAPTARLAAVLSAATGYEVPKSGWPGYPITGDFGDYLAGEGVAAVTVELSDHDDPEFTRNLQGVQALLANAESIVGTEAEKARADLVWLATEEAGNTGAWHYPANTFVHPLALEILSDGAAGLDTATAYLLDSGHILALDLSSPRPAEVLLAPGDAVEGVRVLEPLDLAADGQSLLVLDRAGDVYRYDPGAAKWTMARYDRPSGNIGDHYYIALSSSQGNNYLVETSHEQVWRFANSTQAATSQKGTPWVKLPQGRDVDVAACGGDLYVLSRALNKPTGSLLRYSGGAQVSGFQPKIDLMNPRQVLATNSLVYVLDRAGRRLLALDGKSGVLQTEYQFLDRRVMDAAWASPSGDSLVLAGRDTLYFYDEPSRLASIDGDPLLEERQPNDLVLLDELRGLSMPITGATLTKRDFQMPGAPRHYRLGVHEGIDFYGYAVGVTVDRRTSVRAIADGVVVRAMIDYQPLTAAQNSEWAAQCLNLGYTPLEVLDGYRGMQIWIDHGNGLVSRYAHLSAIAPGIVEGATVTQGQVIGTVGNSGTPSSVYSTTEEVHLHLELWLGDHHVGQFLRPIETREWLEKILR